jgi:hypothetical protein
MIALALHDRTAARGDLARAIAITPHFSILFERLAERTLARLAG